MSLARVQTLVALVVAAVAPRAMAQSSPICSRALHCCEVVTAAGGSSGSTCVQLRGEDARVCGQAMGGLMQAAQALGPNIVAQCTGGAAAPSGVGGYSCACAHALCDSIAARGGGRSNCAGMDQMPASSCNASANAMLTAARTLGAAIPAECGGGGGGGGGGGTDTPPTPPTPPGPPGEGPGSASPPPTPLAPDPPDPTHSPSGRLACVMDRDGGHRVMLAGQVQRFVVRCSGIPLAGNPTGAGAPSNPPQRAADGRTVQIRWNNPPGQLDPLFASAAYTAPSHANPAEVRVSATVALVGPGGRSTESVTVYRTVHVVPRNMHLDFRSEFVTHCHPLTQGSIIVGFDLVCQMGSDLTVSDDFQVHGGAGSSCGVGQLSQVQLCAPRFESRAEPHPGWSLDGVTGQIDPETGVMTLQIQGNRVGMPDVYFTNGRSQIAHTVALFPRPFPIGVDDGSSRTFGSLTTNSTAGGTNTITLHAR